MNIAKSLRALASALMLAFAAITITSCQHDSCVDLNCQNGGVCTDDVCQCPNGFEGPECQYTTASRFTGTWAGTSKCGIYPQKQDTVIIRLVTSPNIVSLEATIGGTSITFDGTANTPELEFNSFNNGSVRIHPLVRVDGNYMQIYIETVNFSDSLRSVCEFEGRKIRD